MSTFIFDINNDAAVVLTNKLEKMHRSALPVAIRGTLNSAAFDVKQNTMLQSAHDTFVERRPNFFKANSKVVMANGFDVNSMRSTVGFISSKLRYNNYAVEELQEQEYGGQIGHRTFVPTDESRGGANTSSVQAQNRLKKIRGIVNVRNVRGYSRNQRFVKAAIKAGRGGYVIGGLRKQMLYRIERIKKIGRRTVIEQSPLYTYEQGRSVSIQATGFMRRASVRSAEKMNKFFHKEAERQFARLRAA